MIKAKIMGTLEVQECFWRLGILSETAFNRKDHFRNASLQYILHTHTPSLIYTIYHILHYSIWLCTVFHFLGYCFRDGCCNFLAFSLLQVRGQEISTVEGFTNAYLETVECSSFWVCHGFLGRDSDIVPERELHRSLHVGSL